jgi:hypothetical protein
LPDGGCGTDANVAYVDPTGTGTTCTKVAPCKKVDDAFKTSRPFVKFSGVTDEAVVVENKNVTFLADPGAKLTRTSVGILVEVRGTSKVEIYDLEISGALGATGIGISLPAGNAASLAVHRATISGNGGGGISATGGTLTVGQSTVSGNQGGGISATGGTLTVGQSTVSGNQGGGIFVSNGTFDITNNFIYRNGNSTGTTVGGVVLAVSTIGTSRLDFNTIVDNEISASTTSSGGLVCDIVGFNASNNLIARNFVNRLSTAVNANTIGQCMHLTSKIVSDLGELKFIAPDVPPYNYHLSAGSTAIDAATTLSTIAVDAEGDVRPQGAQKDVGADEFKP